MKRILFSHSYFYQLDAKQWKISEPYPPLMTITAASLMRSEGYDVELFDVGLKSDYTELKGVLNEFKPDYFVIFDDGFNYLTKMCLTSMREAAFEMQEMASKYGAVVITCSSDSTDHTEKYLEKGADFVIKGEGELTLTELVSDLSSGGDGRSIKGICHKEGSEFKTTAPRGVNTQLDLLPQAAWDLVDLESYRQVWNKKSDTFYLNIATTRGCPYKCNWCAKPIYGNRYNIRSPKMVVDEIQMHVENHQVRHFWMCDDIFGLKPNWVQAFNELVQQRGLKFKYMIQSRVDLLLKEDTIEALVGSGLDTIWLGAESGSQHILDAMDKGITVEQIHEAVPKLQRNGVNVALFLQFGYLGETLQDIRKTIRMVLDIMPEEIGISVSYPLPGTKFYEKVKDDLQAKANWVDSDDLDLMFKNTYSPAFYKRLHRYVHNRHKLKRGLLALQKGLTKPSSLNKKTIRQIATTGYHLPMSIINGSKIKKLARAKA